MNFLSEEIIEEMNSTIIEINNLINKKIDPIKSSKQKMVFSTFTAVGLLVSICKSISPNNSLDVLSSMYKDAKTLIENNMMYPVNLN